VSRLWDDLGNAIVARNGSIERSEDHLRLVGKSDPQLMIDTSAGHGRLEHCLGLSVRIRFSRGNSADQPAQLFYRAPDTTSFDEIHSVKGMPTVDETGVAGIEFRIQNPRGFSPILRFDPADSAGVYEFHELEISCTKWIDR
jgi:hypothetical protein